MMLKKGFLLLVIIFMMSQFVVAGYALTEDDLQWMMTAWEDSAFDMLEPNSNLYRDYPEDLMARIQSEASFFRNVWLCGTLYPKKEMLSDYGGNYRASLLIPDGSKNGMWFSPCIYENTDFPDYVINEETGIVESTANINMFIDTRLITPENAIQLVSDQLSPSLQISKAEASVKNNTIIVDYIDVLSITPSFEFIKERDIQCDDLYKVQIANIEYVPQDGSTTESQHWLSFRTENNEQSWWTATFQIDAPASVLSLIESIYVRSDVRDIFDVNDTFMRLYQDMEFTLDVHDGEFKARIVSQKADASANEIYQRLVMDQIRVWFSFESLMFYGPWHSCASYLK